MTQLEAVRKLENMFGKMEPLVSTVNIQNLSFQHTSNEKSDFRERCVPVLALCQFASTFLSVQGRNHGTPSVYRDNNAARTMNPRKAAVHIGSSIIHLSN